MFGWPTIAPSMKCHKSISPCLRTRTSKGRAIADGCRKLPTINREQKQDFIDHSNHQPANAFWHFANNHALVRLLSEEGPGGVFSPPSQQHFIFVPSLFLPKILSASPRSLAMVKRLRETERRCPNLFHDNYMVISTQTFGKRNSICALELALG